MKHFVGTSGACLSARNMDRNDTNKTTVPRRKHARIGTIHAKSTKMLTAGTRSMWGRTVAPTSSPPMEGITPAIVPPDATVNSVSRQDAGFGYNRTSDGKKNL